MPHGSTIRKKIYYLIMFSSQKTGVARWPPRPKTSLSAANVTCDMGDSTWNMTDKER